MADYDFSALNDKDFEVLCADLLGRRLGVKVERFKPGKDGGVDGRFFTSNGGETIIQCKHWLKSGVAKLVYHLSNSERQKVARINPRDYFLVTSLPLSRTNKADIAEALSPHIASPDRVVGAEDLNGLLLEFPDVEQAHYKLWLTSTRVLTTIIHQAIVGRSRYRLEEVRELACRYVRTGNHANAVDLLEKLHAVIITGEPGIGKTTLANHICLEYAARGYDVVFVEDSLSEAEGVYRDSERQIFHFDDFLGRNYLTALGKKEDSHVTNFIRRVSRDPLKRFVLTSRSSILNQGRQLSDLFIQCNLNRNEYELQIESLAQMDRAAILYNHIWHGDLPPEYVDEFYVERRYLAVIKHRNYNPRLVEFITDYEKVRADEGAAVYWAHVEASLDNPVDVWAHVYDTQHDDTQRLLVALVAINGGAISEERLEAAIGRCELPGGQVGAGTNHPFLQACRVLAGAMLDRKVGIGVQYDLFNPSIGDFVLRRYSGDVSGLAGLFCALGSVESLSTIPGLYRSGVIPEAVLDGVLEQLLVSLGDHSVAVALKVCHLALEREPVRTRCQEVVAAYVQGLDPGESFGSVTAAGFEVLSWACGAGKLALDEACVERVRVNAENAQDEEDLSAMVHFAQLVGNQLEDEEAVGFAADAVVEFWRNTITDYVTENQTLDEFYSEDEVDEARAALEAEVSSLLESYGLDLYWAVSEVCDNVNVEDIIADNAQSTRGDDYDEDRYGGGSWDRGDSDAAIDDLFER